MPLQVVQGTRLPFEQPHHRGTLKRGFCSAPGPQGEGAGPHAIVCAWCGTLVMEGRGPASHGMCVSCIDERHPVRLAVQALGVVAFFPALLLVLSAVVP